MKIEILHGIEGAKQAKGLTIIIDVFRAFTTSCYAIANGATMILATGSLEQAYDLKRQDPSRVLIGERDGYKCKGFDFANSPAEIVNENFIGKEIILTSSAGTQGLVNAVNADEVITGSFVNVGAITHYVKYKKPEQISIVPLGYFGIKPSEEDLICAEYISDMIKDYFRCIKKYQFRVLYHCRENVVSRIEKGSWHKDDLKYCLDFNHFSFVLRSTRLSDDCVVLNKENIW
jgi:2-phosphosulfolactate phosphatase